MTKKTDHRGKILQAAVEKTGWSIERIAQKAGYKRGTYYLHIKQADLSLAILSKYAKVIGAELTDSLPDLKQYQLEEPAPTYSIEPISREEAIRQRNEWKEKYYQLMEKYVACMELAK